MDELRTNALAAASASPLLARFLLAMLCAPLPFLASAWIERLPEPFPSELRLPRHEDSLRSGSGISAAEESSLRSRLGVDGCVLVYFPLDGMTEKARIPLLERLESRTQLYRNLLYPTPREGRMAAGKDELDAALQQLHGRVAVVVDLRQEGVDAPVANAELVHERKEGVRVRHWLVTGGPR